jgi:spermidine synthase
MGKKIKYLINTAQSYLLGRIVERTQSNINSFLEVVHVNGKYILNSENANYSYGTLQKVFEIEFNRLNIIKRPIRDVLILGFGAGSIASILLDKYRLNCNITGVEKDQKVIYLANKYFNVQKFKNTEIICADAYDFMINNKTLYDLIIVDVYINCLVPVNIESELFLSQVKKSLKEKGLVIFNKMIFNKETDKSAKTLYETFSHVMDTSEYHKIHKHHTNLMLVYQHDSAKKASETSSNIDSLHKIF